MMMGGHVALARAFSPSPDLATLANTREPVLICGNCMLDVKRSIAELLIPAEEVLAPPEIGA